MAFKANILLKNTPKVHLSLLTRVEAEINFAQVYIFRVVGNSNIQQLENKVNAKILGQNIHSFHYLSQVGTYG